MMNTESDCTFCSCLYDKIACQEQLKWGRTHFNSWFQRSSIHHDIEDLVAAAAVAASQLMGQKLVTACVHASEKIETIGCIKKLIGHSKDFLYCPIETTQWKDHTTSQILPPSSWDILAWTLLVLLPPLTLACFTLNFYNSLYHY